MTDLSKTIEYIFKLSNDVSAQAGQMKQSVDAANESVHSFETSADAMVDSTDEVVREVEGMRQTAREAASDVRRELDGVETRAKQIDLMTQLTAVMGLREGVSAVTSGMIQLGLVTDEQAELLNDVNAAFSIMAGMVAGIKALQAVMTTLNATSAVGAAIDSFRTAISSPYGAALVGAGVGVAAGVAGMLLIGGGSTTTNSNVTINVTDTTPQQAQSEIYQVVRGGAL